MAVPDAQKLKNNPFVLVLHENEECKTCEDPMNDSQICKSMIKQQLSVNKNVSFSKSAKKEELIPFGKLT